MVNLQPEEVRVSLKGTANLISKIKPENMAIKIDLKNISESSKLNYFAEDYLEIPHGMQIISLHPKMIEVYVEEFDTKEVPVKIRFRGQLKNALKLKEVKVVPDRVTIIGYKSQLNDIKVVMTEEVNLDEITPSQKRKVALKQTRNILKFRDRRDVELLLEIESIPAQGKMMAKLFGTDGIRGRAGKFPLDEFTLIKLGKIIGSLTANPRIVIGRDTRESGLAIEKHLACGLAKKAHIYSSGVIPTPGLAYLTRKLGFQFGIMISASHNP